MTPDRIHDRARGILLGAACGDALGWPQEQRGGLIGGQKARDGRLAEPHFREWTRTAGHYRSRYHDPVRAGDYSDDTQLLLATARACLRGPDWWEHLVEIELPTWLLYQRGAGGAVLRAASSWADGSPPWRANSNRKTAANGRTYREAGANGVAMRIAPHAICASDPTDLVSRVFHDGIATHGHPRALVGGLAYAQALAYAARSKSPLGYGELLSIVANGFISPQQAVDLLPDDWGTSAEIEEFSVKWAATNNEMLELLQVIDRSLRRGSLSRPEETLVELGCCNKSINGAGTVSAAGALYLASRFAARPLSGLLTAAFLRKADTDTLASMTAGLFGAVHGDEWLGDMATTVQDSAYLTRIATALTTDQKLPPVQRAGDGRSLNRELLERLTLSATTASGELPDKRQYRITQRDPLDGGRQRVVLDLSDGQTLIIDTHATSRQLMLDTSKSTTSQLAAYPSGESGDNQNKLVGITFLTSNLERCVDFYTTLLDQKISIHDGTAEIVAGLSITWSPTARPRTNDSTILLTVPSSDTVLSRVAQMADRQPDGSFRAMDPDGRRIVVTTYHPK
ncbi:ADP-ribosylglycohydrolase family protein [Nocardia gipuzkoensis]